jgi:hypothetical protein
VEDLASWTQVEVDLSAFAGQSVLIRWRFGSDSSIGDLGWNIDDVQISVPMPLLPPPTITEVVPNHGSGFQPVPVQILGAGFVETPAVQLGETWLLSVTLVSSTTLDAVVPAGMLTGTYTLTLYNGDCQVGTLEYAFSVGAHLPPETVDDIVAVNEDTISSMDVLANDHDPEGAPLSLVGVGAPTHGDIVISGTLLVYTPNLDYYGTDWFTYTASDGELRGSANVSVTVQPINDSPVMEAGDIWIDPTEPYASQAFTLTGTLADVDTEDSHRVIIEWMPGVSETIDLGVGVLEFSIQHTYPVAGTYTVTVTVSDLTGGEASVTFEITVVQDLYYISLPLIKK